MIPSTDKQFTEHKIKTVNKTKYGFEYETEGGWGWLSIPKNKIHFTPKPGMVAREYGRGSGYPVRGLVINNEIIWYRSPAEEEEKFQRDKKKWEEEEREMTRKATEAGKIKEPGDIKTEQALINYLRSIIDRPHDYNTSAEALYCGALAAFNYTSEKLGNSGFQAGYAGLKLAGKVMLIDPPYRIVDGNHLLYPQYDVLGEFKKWLEEIKPDLAKKARQLLKDKDAHPEVKKRWEEAATWDKGNK